MNIPEPWIFILLCLAVFRVYRLIAEDTILNDVRKWVLRGPLDTWEKEGDDPGEGYRLEWGLFITCPWCLGFWLSGIALGFYCLIIEWVGVFSFLVCWFAISAVVALVAKNLDKEEE